MRQLLLASSSSLLLVSMFITLVNSETSPPDPPEEQMRQIFELLKEGDREIKLDPNHKDLVLLIGNAGAGKTTMSLILTTNCTELESFKSHGRHLIRDVRGDKIGVQTIVSKTIFPDFMINPENNVAIYDCPGFRDTRKRNTSIEFANTLFLKKITDHARSVKVMIIVNYASVMAAAGREDFPNLLQSTLSLLKSVDKFNNSVGMVATKVGNRRDPEEIIEGIKDFLMAAKEDLDKVLKDPADVPRAINLLDALVQDGKNDRSKIHFTWVPQGPGLLSDMEDMMEVRDRIGEIIYNVLDYVNVTPADFGYPFSAEATELQTFILDEIDTFTRSQMSTLAQELRRHWGNKLKNSSITELVTAVAELRNAKDALEHLVQAEKNETSALMMMTQDFASKAVQAFEDMGINVSQLVNFQRFQDQDRFLSLLQSLHGSVQGLDAKGWVQPLQGAMEYIQGMIDWFQAMIELDHQLCLYVVGNSSESCEGYATSTSSSNFVDPQNYKQFFSKVREVLGKEMPEIPVKKFRTDCRRLTFAFLNGMVERAALLRTKITQAFVSDIGRAIEQHFLKDDHDVVPIGEYRASIENVHSAITRLLRTPSDGTITTARVLEEIRAAVTSAGIEHLLSPSSIETVTHQGSVTHSLIAIGSPELGKLSRAESLHPLEDTATFFTAATAWFGFLDRLEEKLSAYKLPLPRSSDNNSSTANYVQRRSVIPALEEFSGLMSLQMPARGVLNPTAMSPFVSHLNEILYRAWNSRKEYMMGLLDDLSHQIIGYYRAQSGCDIDVAAFRRKIQESTRFLEDTGLSLAMSSSSQGSTPVYLAQLFQGILTALQVEPPSLGSDIIQQIQDQNEVFSVLVYLTPQLADVDVARAIMKLQKVTAYLRSAEGWYDYMHDLELPLLGEAYVSNSSRRHVPNDHPALTQATWYSFVNQTAVFFNLSAPPTASDVLDQGGLVCYVDNIAKTAYKSRVLSVKTNVQRLASKLHENFLLKAHGSKDARNFVRLMYDAQDIFSRLASITSRAPVVSVKNFMGDLVTCLEPLSGTGNEVTEILQTLQQSSDVFELLKQASVKFSEINSAELTEEFGQVIVFIADSIKWFDYLEQLDSELSAYELSSFPELSNTSDNTIAVAPTLATPGNLVNVLQQLSTLVNISQPLVGHRIPTQDAFIHHASRILHQAWAQCAREVTESTRILSSSLLQYYYQLTSRLDVEELRDETLRAFRSFKTVMNSDDMDSSLQSGRALSQLLLATLTDLAISMDPTIQGLLDKIQKQDEVLEILGQVSPTLSHIQLRAALRKVGPLTEQLEHASSWFQFLSNFQKQLGQYALKTVRPMPNTMAEQAPTRGVENTTVAFQFIQELASILDLQVPTSFEMLHEVTDTDRFLHYVNTLVLWIHQSRSDEIKQLVEDVNLLVVKEFAARSANSSLQAPNFKDFVKSSKSIMQELTQKATGQMDSNTLAVHIRRALMDIFQVAEPFESELGAIAKQDEIIGVMAMVKPEFAKIDATSALSPLADLKFLTDSLVWYEFLDSLSTRLCKRHGPAKRPPSLWVTPQNAFDALSLLARTFSLALPAGRVNPTSQNVFLKEVNNLFYCAWDMRNQKISALLDRLSTNITAYYEDLADSFTNLPEFLKKLEQASAALSGLQELRRNKRYKPTAHVLSQNISRVLRGVGMNSTSPVFKQIKKEGEVLQNFVSISADLSTVDRERCLAALEGVSKYLDRIISWYDFLDKLDARLSHYEAQRNKQVYKVDSLEWRQFQGNGTSGSPLKTPDEAIKLVNHVCARLHLSAPRDYQDNFNNSVGPTPALRHLNSLLHRTLVSPMECSVVANILTVRGEYIIMSQALSCLREHVERMIINAHHTFFIDTDVNAVTANNGTTFDVVAIARNTVAVSSHTVNLSGANAPVQGTGAHGSPGLPGQNGGSFYLISTSLRGTLSVITSGGSGSDGSPGPAGLPGDHGSTPTMSNWGNWTDPPCDPLTQPDFQIQSSFPWRTVNIVCEDICSAKTHLIQGTEGQKGGDGGDGGKGGVGGKPGISKVLLLLGNSTTVSDNFIRAVSENGQHGADGPGGKGGLGGLKGGGLIVALARDFRFDMEPLKKSPRPDFSVKWSCKTEFRIESIGSNGERAQSGEDGKAGGNEPGIIPTAPPKISTRDVDSYVQTYIASRSGSIHMDVFTKPAHQRFIRLLRQVSL